MSAESHLKHHRAELSLLKDSLLAGEIKSDEYQVKARILEKKIKEEESQLRRR